MRTMPKRTPILVAVAVTIGFATLVPGAARADIRDVTELQTSYLHEPHEIHPFRATHRISISALVGGRFGGRGTLLLDPNECFINDFGDPEGCTKAGIMELDITLKPIKAQDPFGVGQGRRLFEIVGEGLMKRLLLVTPVTRGVGEVYRLIIQNEQGFVERVVTLEIM